MLTYKVITVLYCTDGYWGCAIWKWAEDPIGPDHLGRGGRLQKKSTPIQYSIFSCDALSLVAKNRDGTQRL